MGDRMRQPGRHPEVLQVKLGAVIWFTAAFAVVAALSQAASAQERQRNAPGCLGSSCRDAPGPLGPSRSDSQNYQLNLTYCLLQFPFCDRRLLNPDDLAKVTQAAYDSNLSDCVAGRPTCQPEQVRPDHVGRVKAAAYARKVLQCASEHRSCRLSELQPEDRAAIAHIQFIRNRVACDAGLPSCERQGPQQSDLRNELDQLAAATREIEAFKVRVSEMTATTQVARKSAEQAISRERDRADALARDLASVRQALEASKSGEAQAFAAVQEVRNAIADHKDAGAAERESLNHELAAARQELETVKARFAATFAAQQEARETAAATEQARGVASVRDARDVSMRAAAQITVPDQERRAVVEQARASERQDTDAFVAESATVHQQPGPPVSDRAGPAVPISLEPSSLETGSAKPDAVPRGNDEPRKTQAEGVAIASTSERASVAHGLSESSSEARFLDRAEMLISRGDISGARAVLRLALANGSARAAFKLAETYDKRMLSQWHAFGTQEDANTARELYRRAYDAGFAPAKERAEGMAIRRE